MSAWAQYRFTVAGESPQWSAVCAMLAPERVGHFDELGGRALGAAEARLPPVGQPPVRASDSGQLVGLPRCARGCAASPSPLPVLGRKDQLPRAATNGAESVDIHRNTAVKQPLYRLLYVDGIPPEAVDLSELLIEGPAHRSPRCASLLWVSAPGAAGGWPARYTL